MGLSTDTEKGDFHRTPVPPGKRAKGPAAQRAKKASASRVPASRVPDAIAPQLATLVDAVPTGDTWVYEIKLDGYRAIGYVDRADQAQPVRLVSRNKKDWTNKLAPLATALATLPCQHAVVDGEVVVFLPDGTTSFQVLQNELGKGDGKRLRYVVFDLMFLDGKDLRGLPLLERKTKLAALLRALPPGSPLAYSDHLQNDGEKMFELACSHGVEGIVAKRADAPYESRRSLAWVKVKCQKRQEFVIGGYTDPEGSRTGLGALLLGYYEAHKLVYAGRVGTGFTRESLTALHDRLAPKIQKTSPFDLKSPRQRGIHWVKPEHVAEVRFSNWTDDGMLRHPTFQGLREDKPAREVRQEKPVTKRAIASTASGDIAGVRITHPERLVYPEAGITKRAVAEYYVKVADRMLPHVRNRPLTLVRCPQGHGRQCFFQRHLNTAATASVPIVRIRDDKGLNDYMYLTDVTGLVSVVQMGALELHPWGCHIDAVENPDLMVFDLDPGAGIGTDDLVQAAHTVRNLLADLKLQSFAKVTGGKGVHVVVPITPDRTWDDVLQFTETVANFLSHQEPTRYTASTARGSRDNRIFIDYLRNGRGNSAVAPFSTRSRPGAPIALPVAWEELLARLRHPPTVLDHIDLTVDPWAQFFEVKQGVTPDMTAILRGALPTRKAPHRP